MKMDLGVGQFEKKLENLTVNTEYYIKSYGQNSSGLVYGSELVQRTLPSPIPVEYQLVEYLESSGTQYINTGYTPVQQHTITTNIAFNTTHLGYCGSANSNVSPQPRLFFGSSTNPNLLSITTGATSSYTIPFDTSFHIYTISPNNILIDNIGNNNEIIYNNILTLLLFARNVNGNISNYCKAKIEYFKVLDSNNQYIRRMYPVYRISDNKPGMYDIVNGVFYTNQGTGEFTVGPDKEWDE